MLPSNAADQEKKIDGSNLLIGGGGGVALKVARVMINSLYA